MNLDQISVTDDPSRADMTWLDEQLYAFNAARTGITDGRYLVIFLRDADAQIVAGLYGWTWGDTCEVRTLWVHEAWRARGVGSRLLQAAEAEARARGARQIVLDTHSFQAPDFYCRFGFERIGEVEEYPRGHTKIFMRKRLR
jgi:N-acetylglutamate synthase-like GNAT family acetyltransferase